MPEEACYTGCGLLIQRSNEQGIMSEPRGVCVYSSLSVSAALSVSLALFVSCSLSRYQSIFFFVHCQLLSFPFFRSLWLCLTLPLYPSALTILALFHPAHRSLSPSICLVCWGALWRTLAKSQTLLGFVYSSSDDFIACSDLHALLVLTRLTRVTHMWWWNVQ